MAEDTKKQYRLENLSCANCAAKFEKNVNAISTVDRAEINFGASKLTVYGEATVDELEAAGAFDGIKVLSNQTRKIEKVPFYKQKENVLAAISLLFLLTAVLFEQLQFSNAVVISTYIISIVVGGVSIFKVGLLNLLKFEFDMKTLMTIAIIGAAIIGEWQEAALVVFLFAVSEALEAFSMNKARNSIAQLMDIAPTTAIVLKKHGDHAHEVVTPTEQIEIGDLILVKPGQKVAMDGEVIEGQSTINESSITGESIPVAKTVGAQVFAGTMNETGSFTMKVTKRVEDSTLAKIIHLVEEAQTQKAPSQKFVDRFAKYYTPFIILSAILVAIIPSLITGDWIKWIYQGLAVLVVGCPCALVISTPVAIVTAIGNAARQGVLIKGGAYLEELSRIKVIAFDKTGTLTKGTPEVKEIYTFNSISKNELLTFVASVEKHSQHPLARAILDKAFQEKITIPNSTDFLSITGKGAQSVVGEERFYVGSPKWMREWLTFTEEIETLISDVAKKGQSIIMAASDTKIYGLIAVADSVREESVHVISKLKDLNIEKTIMLTGDGAITANVIARQIGITDVSASLLPEQKLAAIKAHQVNSPIAMVGDGINDAPALATANIGIAMGGAGTDVALETADIALMSDDLQKLPETIKLSKKTVQIIKQNIAFALGLKVVALLLVIPGWLTLWIAIFADMGATLLVVLNSLRLMAKTK